MVVYVRHDWMTIARKPGSNFLPSKRSDYRILGGGGYFLGGGGFIWVMGGGGEYFLDGGGWW